MSANTLDQILDALDVARQRATYGAVAGVLGLTPRTLMKGRERDQRHSWVVGHKTGTPTGYESDQLHPELHTTDHVIESHDEMATWLRARADHSGSAEAAA